MLAEYARVVTNRAQAFMILMGYIMALAAFFVTLAQIGEITQSMRVLMYALLAVPILSTLAAGVESIASAREHT